MIKDLFIELFNKETNENNILSNDDVIKLTNGLFSGILGKWGNWKIKQNKKKKVLFGLKSGVLFYEKEVLIIINKNKVQDLNYNSKTYPFIEYIKLEGNYLKVRYGYEWYTIQLSSYDRGFFVKFFKNYKVKLREKNKKKTDRQTKINENKKQKLIKNISLLVEKFDKDDNGIIDIIETNDEFNKLFKNHQKTILSKSKEFNQNYTHQLVKVGNYLDNKRKNLQLIFDSIKKIEEQSQLIEYSEILENEIHSYNLLLLNSLQLIVSLIDDNQITFYNIYEKFDKLNLYNSNWENEVLERLSKINSNLKGLMYEIRDMGDRIVNSIEDLSYITEESTKLLDNRLGEIDSSIKTNNLLTLIQTYQTYKINKNTKSLR